MKTKDYLNKYHLEIPNGINKLNHNDFVADLTIDFMTLLEVGNSTKNIKGFENAVRAIHMKWNAINNKTVGQLPDKLWSYFYATVIIGYKKELFPEILAERERQRVIREGYKREQNRFYSFEEDFFSSFFKSAFSSFISDMFKKASIPQDAFTRLGLVSSASETEVKEAYRGLALLHHPDKGGDMSLFIAITEAKNKCLMYLKNKI